MAQWFHKKPLESYEAKPGGDKKCPVEIKYARIPVTRKTPDSLYSWSFSEDFIPLYFFTSLIILKYVQMMEGTATSIFISKSHCIADRPNKTVVLT